MKGTIVSAWVDTCKDLYGHDITNEALSHFGIKTYIPSCRLCLIYML